MHATLPNIVLPVSYVSLFVLLRYYVHPVIWQLSCSRKCPTSVVIAVRSVPNAVSYTHLDVYKRQAKAYAALGEKTKAMPLLKYLTAESEDYINWAFSLGDNRINMVQRDCLYKFWQWNQYNELVKEIDKEEYRLSNQRFFCPSLR